MKQKLFLLILTALWITTAFAQTDRDEIRKNVEVFFKATQQSDYEKLLDYIYPKVFETYPKEELLKNMKKMQTDSTFSFSIENSKIENISDLMEVDGIKYALITYSYKMYLTIAMDKNDTEEEKELFNKMMLGMYKNMYGEDNVQYDKKSGRFIIISTHEMFAIKDPKYKGWKFLEKIPEEESLKRFIPEEVLEKF